MLLGLTEGIIYISYAWDAKELKNYEFSWVYQSFGVNAAGEDCYSFSIIFPDGTERPGLLRVTEFELLVEIKPDGSNLITLFKPEYHEESFVGYWISGYSDNFYYAELEADRSFTSNIDGEISGTWHAKPIMDSIGKGYSKRMSGSGVFQTYLALWYEKDGQMCSEVTGIELSAPEFYLWGMRGVHGAERDIINDVRSYLVGDWTSVTFTESYYAPGNVKESEERKDTAEYSVSISEDGRFTALLDGEYVGKAFVTDLTEKDNGNEKWTTVSIYFVPEEMETELIGAEMYYYPDTGLANALRIYLADHYENGNLKYSGIYFFRKT